MELADRLLDDLLALARTSANGAGDAAGILERWDRTADSASRGGVLFTQWWTEYVRRTRGRAAFAIPWSESNPRLTPDGLADTAAAIAALAAGVDTVTRRYGATDVAWGSVYRLRRDSLDYAASGSSDAYGVFRVLGYSREPDGKFAATGGTSYVAAIEFTTPVRAASLIGYGNASRAGSKHRTDQLALFARKESKPVWRSRTEIQKHLERREIF